MASGERLTAVELQWKFFEAAKRFHDSGGCEGRVPRAGDILELWGDTLQKLEHRNFDALGRRLDWVLKWHAVNRAMSRRPELTWESPEVKHLDHLYCSLDTADGLYWAYQKAGVLESHVQPAEIERFVHEPPDDTRAWTRARLMRLAGAERTDNIDWDTMRFKVNGSRGWPSYPSLELADPLGWSRAETESVFPEGAGLEDVLSALKEIAERDEESAGSSASSSSNGGPKLLTGPTATSKKKKSMWSSWTN
jgi:proteasome accessory factor A